jgi:hypothetical protein
VRSLVCCDGNQFLGADQRGREEMLMITAWPEYAHISFNVLSYPYLWHNASGHPDVLSRNERR